MRIGDRVIVDKLSFESEMIYSHKDSPVGYKGEVVDFYIPKDGSEERVTVKLDNWPYDKGLACFFLSELRYE